MKDFRLREWLSPSQLGEGASFPVSSADVSPDLQWPHLASWPLLPRPRDLPTQSHGDRSQPAAQKGLRFIPVNRMSPQA